jgi:predicted RNase H-like HicB family nuclease
MCNAQVPGDVMPCNARPRAMKEYHINVFCSGQDKCWIADIPDLRFCSACGSTPEEALVEVQKAKRAWRRFARDRGKRIPKPRYCPAIYQANG